MPHTSQTSENTGLIDLKVLTGAPGQRSSSPRATPSLFPPEPAPGSLPPSAFAVEVADAPKATKRSPFAAVFSHVAPFVVPLGGAFVIAVATFAALLQFPSEEPVVPPPLVARPLAAMSLPDTAAAPVADVTSANALNAAADPASPAPAKSHRASGAGKAKGGTVATPAPRKAVDRCGCKGNFDCIIRCSAKGK